MTAPARDSTSDPTSGARAARDAVALHDASATRIFDVTGKHRTDLLQRLSTNDLKKIEVGRGHTNVLTTNKGRIVDWVRICPFDDSLLVFASPGNGDAVRQWIDRYTISEDIKLDDVTERHAQFELLGPRASEVAAKLEPSAASWELNSFRPLAIAGHDAILIATEGLVKHKGYLVLTKRANAAAVKAELLKLGADAGIVEQDEPSYEAARIEHGVPRFGADLGEEFHPLEAGLWGSVSFTKGCYVGQEVIARLNTYDKVMKNLVMLKFSGEVKRGERMFSKGNGKDVGVVTSVAGPPVILEWRGLGYLKKKIEGEVFVGSLEEGAVSAVVDGVVRV